MKTRLRDSMAVAATLLWNSRQPSSKRMALMRRTSMVDTSPAVVANKLDGLDGAEDRQTDV